MNLLAVDPGQRGCGVAIFSDEESKRPCRCRSNLACDCPDHPTLVRAAYVLNYVDSGNGAESWAGMARAVRAWLNRHTGCHRLIIECPQVYPGPQQKGGTKGQNDLIALAAVAGTIVGELREIPSVSRVLPREWKGTLDADEMTKRVRGRLSPTELARCEPCPKSLEHNLLDAVGIGLHAVGRLEPRRVIAR